MFTFYQVDAFTSSPFKGNPACVCVLQEAASEEWMQKFSAEMNLSETAYLYEELNGKKKGFNLRWFTPVREVPLCGHATLASAHILWEQKILSEEEDAVFFTKTGELTAKRVRGAIEMNFPNTGYEKIDITDEIQKAVGQKIIQASTTREDLLIELQDEKSVREFQPNLNAIINLPFRGLIISARGEMEFDFVSRFFVPKIGINEDPVTGSAHCVLTPYWHERLNKNSFRAYQASKRGGVVLTRFQGDRVFLIGNAVTVFTGQAALFPENNA